MKSFLRFIVAISLSLPFALSAQAVWRVDKKQSLVASTGFFEESFVQFEKETGVSLTVEQKAELVSKLREAQRATQMASVETGNYPRFYFCVTLKASFVGGLAAFKCSNFNGTNLGAIEKSLGFQSTLAMQLFVMVHLPTDAGQKISGRYTGITLAGGSISGAYYSGPRGDVVGLIGLDLGVDGGIAGASLTFPEVKE